MKRKKSMKRIFVERNCSRSVLDKLVKGLGGDDKGAREVLINRVVSYPYSKILSVFREIKA
jgi:hypothetical protein